MRCCKRSAAASTSIADRMELAWIDGDSRRFHLCQHRRERNLNVFVETELISRFQFGPRFLDELERRVGMCRGFAGKFDTEQLRCGVLDVGEAARRIE